MQFDLWNFWTLVPVKGMCVLLSCKQLSLHNGQTICIVLNDSELQSRADSPDGSRPKTLHLEQSSTQSRNSISGPLNTASIPSHLKPRRSLATESVRRILLYASIIIGLRCDRSREIELRWWQSFDSLYTNARVCLACVKGTFVGWWYVQYLQSTEQEAPLVRTKQRVRHCTKPRSLDKFWPLNSTGLQVHDATVSQQFRDQNNWFVKMTEMHIQRIFILIVWII